MASESDKRFMIIATALGEVQIGSHYLQGSDGAIPGESGSGLFRRLDLHEDLTIDHLGVHAAKNDWGVCHGRYEKVYRGKKFAKGEDDRDRLLPEYLDELKASYLPSKFWKDFNKTGLYPRRDSGYIFLGEDCRNKRHFDCEGFIAWVLVRALKKDPGTWRQGVTWYQNGGGGRLNVYQHTGGGDYYNEETDATISTSEILDGDILIRKPNKWGGEHIAFALAKGRGVFEASGANRGVIKSAYHPDWTQLARIKTV
jgi:hypothetical protein